MDKPISIITPCYNEEKAILPFLQQLEVTLRTLTGSFNVIVVDDASSDTTVAKLREFRFSTPNVNYLPIGLPFNVGHQAAIFQGLSYARQFDSDHFIIMDSDGEDSPEAIPELVKYTDCEIVHVVRGRRNEGWTFLLFYYLYKALFRFVTGKTMNFGNYCMINRRVLGAALLNSWVHFPAMLLRQKVSRKTITWNRERRLDGKSKMSMQGLLYHAFRSLVEYAEDLLMLFLRLFILISILFVLAISNVLYQKFIAHTAILGWTSVIAIGLLNLAVISLGVFILGALLLNLANQRNENLRREIYVPLHPGQERPAGSVRQVTS